MEGDLDEALLAAGDPRAAGERRKGRVQALAVGLVAGGAVGVAMVNLRRRGCRLARLRLVRCCGTSTLIFSSVSAIWVGILPLRRVGRAPEVFHGGGGDAGVRFGRLEQGGEQLLVAHVVPLEQPQRFEQRMGVLRLSSDRTVSSTRAARPRLRASCARPVRCGRVGARHRPGCLSTSSKAAIGWPSMATGCLERAVLGDHADRCGRVSCRGWGRGCCAACGR